MVSIKPFSVTKHTALNGGGYLYSILHTAPGPRHQSASPQLMVGVIEQLVWEPEANNRSSKAQSGPHAEQRVTFTTWVICRLAHVTSLYLEGLLAS
jgi:hypothetical protein